MSEASTVAPGPLTRVLYAVVLLVLVGVGYSDVATSFFLCDDFNYLNIIRDAETLWDGTAIDSGWMFFRPLTALSFWFNYLVFGYESATSYHVVALVSHWVNAYLVARLAWRFVPDPIGAALAGAAFAVLPVHPECITWISARADVLSAIGTLLMLTGFVDWLRRERGAWAIVECLFGFVFALGTKDSAIILPVVCAAMLFTPRERQPREIVAAFGVLGVVLAAYFALRYAALGAFLGSQAETQGYYNQINLENAAYYVFSAFRLLLIPGPANLGNGLCMIVVLYMLLRHPNLGAFVRLAWPLGLVFLLHLAPVANVARLGLDDLSSTRFLYMPSMFWAVALGTLIGTGVRNRRADLRELRRAYLLMVASCGLLVAYTMALRTNNQPWADAARISETLVQDIRKLDDRTKYKWLLIAGLPEQRELRRTPAGDLRWAGPYVFKNGIDTATKLFVREDLVFPPHGKLDEKQWEDYAAQRRADPSKHPTILMLRWDPEKRELITP